MHVKRVAQANQIPAESNHSNHRRLFHTRLVCRDEEEEENNDDLVVVVVVVAFVKT